MFRLQRHTLSIFAFYVVQLTESVVSIVDRLRNGREDRKLIEFHFHARQLFLLLLPPKQ